MNKKPPRTEKGQILVILVLALVGLLGFTALAIDGSMVFSDRRYDQSAADSAALAGAQSAAFYIRDIFLKDAPDYIEGSSEDFACDKAWVLNAMNQVDQAVISRAATNHFNLSTADEYYSSDDLEKAKHGYYVECRFIDTNNENNGVYVHVMLTNTVSTTLVHFVSGGPISNTVTAIARADPATPLSYGAAIVATRTDCPNNNTGGVQFQGSGNVEIVGGDIFSNFCLFKNGSGEVDVTGGEIYYNDKSSYQNPGNPACGEGTPIDPCPTKTSDQLFFYDIQGPNCDYYTAFTTWPGSNVPNPLPPGKYNQDPKIAGNGNLKLQKGLYCFYRGFSVGGNDPKDGITPKLEGEGVTIAIMGGSMDIAGGVTVKLTAPPISANPPAVPGLLIYQPPTNTNALNLGGNSKSTMEGTIFAPGGPIFFSGTSSISGTGDLEKDCYGLQVIGNSVIINGTPNVCIYYDKNNNYFYWPSVSMTR